MKGGKKEEVAAAVQQLETTPDPHALFVHTAKFGLVYHGSRPSRKKRDSRRPTLAESEVFLDRIHPVTALALEMAAHEDIERRAMEGELAILEAAWRQAEEIASIADNLLVAKNVDEQFAQLRETDQNSR